MALRNRTIFIGGPFNFAFEHEVFNQEIKQTLEISIQDVNQLNVQVLSAKKTELFGI
ncbi:hypothetical protein LW957_17600 [Erwinia amylovora]|uniref:hypothetical protein n=1 Tax=Erwinia amylovora TaxID=552 RepID=UPI0020C1823C|nr:hypothetical protein [Erwinia amylovora]MCK8292682.1 hypothetical protein [Erwinia amylovora]